MPQERLSICKASEVLRLIKACKLSNRAIARSCQLSHSTFGEYLKRAEAAGLSWPLPEEFDEETLERLLYPEVIQESRGTVKPVPDLKEVHGELKKRSVTLTLLRSGSSAFQLCKHLLVIPYNSVTLACSLRMLGTRYRGQGIRDRGHGGHSGLNFQDFYRPVIRAYYGLDRMGELQFERSNIHEQTRFIGGDPDATAGISGVAGGHPFGAGWLEKTPVGLAGGADRLRNSVLLLALFTQLTTAHHGVNWRQVGVAFLEALVRAGAWGLVLAAMFGWRK